MICCAKSWMMVNWEIVNEGKIFMKSWQHYLYMCVYESISVCMCVCVCEKVCVCVRLSVAYLPACLLVACLLLCLCVSLSLFVCLSACLSVILSAYLDICLFICDCACLQHTHLHLYQMTTIINILKSMMKHHDLWHCHISPVWHSSTVFHLERMS